jgi:signal transduction histidine kinase
MAKKPARGKPVRRAAGKAGGPNSEGLNSAGPNSETANSGAPNSGVQKLAPGHLHELYRVIAEEAFMGFCTFDLNTRQCAFMNKRARELFEIGDRGTDFCLALDQIFAGQTRGDFRAFNEDLIAHEGLYQDIALKRGNGQTFIANVGVKRIRVDDQLTVLLMIQDVTLQKKLQREVVAKQVEIKAAFEELLKQNKQLKELDLAKNRFIALTTHELRTPLAAMVASAEILHLGLYDTPEQMKEFITMIYEQGHHLHELVNDILDFAKIQAGRMDFYIENHAVEPVVKAVVEGFHSMADGQKVLFDVKAAPEPAAGGTGGALSCFFDELRLKQVLGNIINNAIKYNREGGTVSIWMEEKDRMVRIYVRDTGNGIAPEQIEKVFNEFETLGQVAAHHKGTGLGMPISRRLMEGMGGRLLVESQVGQGSTFWVEIPIEKVLAEELYRPRPGGPAGDLAA